MSIKSVTIKNFQSHKKSVFNLHHGVNAIVGLSDCGKSAVLRSLGWVIRNKSEDRSFRSNWGGKTDVEIVFADGQEVSRTQEKHNCYYLVDSKNNVDEEYTAFKTAIPEDITAALNMDSINIQSQFDRPFLLDESAGDVAKILNDIANLSDIDESISNIRKLVLANSRELSNSQAMIQDLETQLESFTYLKDMEKDVAELEFLESNYNNTEEDILVLSVYIEHITKDQSDIDELDSFLKCESVLTDTLALVDTLNAVTSQTRVLYETISNVDDLQCDIEDIKKIIEAEKDVDLTLKLVDELKTSIDVESKLNSLIQSMNIQEGRLRSVNKNLDSWEFEFRALMGKCCPLCERSL
jgi:exonuclease SbcC